ncbi:Aminoglycoside phosphotransferase [Venturia nashicola]|nr:Aminoglycoside phosphotransferase [Venturia nashicola]
MARGSTVPGLTYEAAIDSESDVIRHAEVIREAAEFLSELEASAPQFEQLVAHHLGLPDSQRCSVWARKHWMSGGFNIGIPIDVLGQGVGRRVFMRIPRPHKIAEQRFPGAIEEKMRCEIGTYAYIQDDCKDIPIAHLIGFGLPGGQTFTHAKHVATYQRFFRSLQRFFCSALRWPCPSYYINHPSPRSRGFSYILLEYVSAGAPLVSTWNKYRDDPVRRQNLYKGISNIAISLGQKPWPCIGSLRFLDDATYGLHNRPLSCHIPNLENNVSERVIDTSKIYSDAHEYYMDLMAYQESRFVRQPNSVFNEHDCRAQMAVYVYTRSLLKQFSLKEPRNGPFYLTFSDENVGHFFVDENWNVTKIVDLEWVCSWPTAMSGTPYWLSALGIDQIYGKTEEDFLEIQTQYLDALRENEDKRKASRPLSSIIKHNWDNNAFWLLHGLTSVDALFNICRRHLLLDVMTQPGWENAAAQFDAQSDALVQRKVAEKAVYNARLKELYLSG